MSEANPTYDPESESRQEAHDRVCKKFDSGDFDMDIGDWFFNRPDMRKMLKQSLVSRDHALSGRIIENACYLFLMEKEDE